MELLLLCDDTDGDVLPALDLLDHAVQRAPLSSSDGREPHGDLVLVDATADLRAASARCRSLTLADPTRAVVVVVREGSLAVLKQTWGFDDWLLPDASAVEVETRLRIARDRALARHDVPTARVGDLVVDEESYQVRLRGQPLDLTYREFELLKALASSPNRVFTREVLLDEVWGYDYYGGSRTVDVHVRRLRAKLGPEHDQMIVTVRGVGYKLVPPRPRG